ncbi:amidohydrolase family protein [Mechercharimyces sp. CAU 1602]|uniref:amidohydrolase family protein n=1 Tax=Mechercharimyces sp. CAU 1602 TaxID=2973933 RepID=UPI0021617F18|nr:amidohydrolase family protein [Mechercharimyces sp. CAU 1602]MCS1351332.1 amidohydrolase family protein [Mechercharimyces sp. CAU 1602]
MGIFDAHFHIIDPRFPLIKNQEYLPPSYTVKDYCKRTDHLDIVGGAVVSGSFQAFDQSYLLDALSRLGEMFVGVTQLPFSATDEEITYLHRNRVRAVRFNVRRGGSESILNLEALAKRVYELAGWHVELYIESRFLPEIASVIKRLPAVSIDHLGLTRAGFPTLLQLVDRGMRVKATGFGRTEVDIKESLRTIVAVNPNALLFGTDLPSTRAARPFRDLDIQWITETVGEGMAQKVLFQNAVEWYGVDGKG